MKETTLALTAFSYMCVIFQFVFLNIFF